MRIYPEIESWNEFYPNEIFINLSSDETEEDIISVANKANLGATLYVGLTSDATVILKKIDKVENFDDYTNNLLMIGFVSSPTGGV